MLEIRKDAARGLEKIAPLLSARVSQKALAREDNIIQLGGLLEQRLEPKMSPAEMTCALVEAVLEIEFGQRNAKKASWRRMTEIIAGAVMRNKTLSREADLYLSRIMLRKIKAV